MLPFKASDLIQGVTLADRLEAGSLNLNPSNIILDANSEPHVVDVGIAKHEAGKITMTMDKAAPGPSDYLSRV